MSHLKVTRNKVAIFIVILVAIFPQIACGDALDLTCAADPSSVHCNATK